MDHVHRSNDALQYKRKKNTVTFLVGQIFRRDRKQQHSCRINNSRQLQRSLVTEVIIMQMDLSPFCIAISNPTWKPVCSATVEF